MKISLLGQSGSGKTTLGRKLSRKLGIRFIELDQYWFEVNKNRGDFTEKVNKVLDENSNWIIDGKYKSVRERIIAEADIIVLFQVSLYKLIFRNIIREVRSNKKITRKFISHITKMVSDYSKVEKQFELQLYDYQEKVIIVKSFDEVYRLIGELGS